MITLFQEENLSLFSPKKDLCDTCVAHENGLITDVEYNNHIAKKNAARAEKEKDTKNEEFVFTMDLESVLLSPRSNVSAMYYKTKLIVHNFTIYHMRSHRGYCFVWNESEGCVTANEFTTIITNFIENIVQQHGDKVKKIIIFSDGCGYQHLSLIHI